VCNSCGLDHPPSSRWLLARALGVLAAGVIAVAVLLLHGSPSRSAAAPRPVAVSNTDRVFASDNCRQENAGRALAYAGEHFTVPEIRRVAAQLARLERAHAARPGAKGCSAAASPPITSRRAYLSAVRDHLQSDVLVARIEESDGTDRRLRRRAATVVSRAQPALASLPRA